MTARSVTRPTNEPTLRIQAWGTRKDKGHGEREQQIPHTIRTRRGWVRDDSRYGLRQRGWCRRGLRRVFDAKAERESGSPTGAASSAPTGSWRGRRG